MTFKEKSRKKPDDKSTVESAIFSFSDIVDNACEGLKDRQIKYTIRRIQEMKDCLNDLEQELIEFLELKMEN